MDSSIIVALISVLGTVLGSALGIVTSQSLTNHRLSQLEAKVDKHNSVVERMAVMEEKDKVQNHRIDDLEEVFKNRQGAH